jgi:hypothetical protein
MSSGNHHAAGVPGSLAALDAVAFWRAPHALYCGTSYYGGPRIACVLLEERGDFRSRHEAIGIIAAIRPARQSAHPVGRQEAEGIPTLAAPPLADLASFQQDMLDAKPTEAIA